MILSNEGIRAALQSGELEISPLPREDQYTTSAVDLFVGDDFRIWDREKITVPGVRVELNLAEQEFHKTALSFLVEERRDHEGCVILPPYGIRPCHLLAITQERLCLRTGSRLAARVEGRSSFARLGLLVHLTAPTIHAGYQGRITLEMINFGPFYLRLVPTRTRICQLIFERLETDPEGEPATAFQGQETPAGERYVR